MLDKKSNSKNGYISSIRQNTFDLLEKNPLLTAKSLCKLMELPYEKYLRYMNRLRYEWKSNHRNEHGSKCSIHAWKGWCYVPSGLDRSKAFISPPLLALPIFMRCPSPFYITL